MDHIDELAGYMLDDRRRARIHEAGHAVIGRASSLETSSITVFFGHGARPRRRRSARRARGPRASSRDGSGPDDAGDRRRGRETRRRFRDSHRQQTGGRSPLATGANARSSSRSAESDDARPDALVAGATLSQWRDRPADARPREDTCDCLVSRRAARAGARRGCGPRRRAACCAGRGREADEVPDRGRWHPQELLDAAGRGRRGCTWRHAPGQRHLCRDHDHQQGRHDHRREQGGRWDRNARRERRRHGPHNRGRRGLGHRPDDHRWEGDLRGRCRHARPPWPRCPTSP